MRRLLPWPPADGLTDDDLRAAYQVPPGDRPHVRVNFVTSLDGASTIDGRSAGLATPGDQRIFRLLRTLADVVLVGAGTVRTEGYAGPLVDDEQRAVRASLGLSALPRKAVVSHSLDIDVQAPFFTEPPRPLVVTRTDADPAKQAALAEVADLVAYGDSRVDLGRTLEALAGNGLRQVLCEGGPALFGALLEAAVVDELCLTLTDMIAGDPTHRLVHTRGQVLTPASLAHVLEEDGALFLRYRLRVEP
jgi:riboflavin biosynthesis pyrimidine reductase